MATDPDNRRSWGKLLEAARAAEPPRLDVRAAVRARIAAERAAAPPPALGLLDEVADLLFRPWGRTAFAAGCCAAAAVAWAGFAAANELAWALAARASLPL